jgi:nucleoid-associated protein YgaU
VRKDVKTGMLIGLAIAIAAMAMLMVKKDSGLGVAESGVSLKQIENQSGRPGDNAGPAVVYEQSASIPSGQSTATTASNTSSSAPLVPVKSTRFHIIREGETLSSISKKHYGTTTSARKIFEANRNVLQDPDHLRAGTKLTIPD